MVYAPHTEAISAACQCGALVDPLFTIDGGQIVVSWPDGRGACTVAPEVVEGWAEQINQLRAEVAALRDHNGA